MNNNEIRLFSAKETINIVSDGGYKLDVDRHYKWPRVFELIKKVLIKTGLVYETMRRYKHIEPSIITVNKNSIIDTINKHRNILNEIYHQGTGRIILGYEAYLMLQEAILVQTQLPFGFCDGQATISKWLDIDIIIVPYFEGVLLLPSEDKIKRISFRGN